MGEFSSQVLTLFSRAASGQAGIISGDNPTTYNASDPLRLWIIQLVIIISVTQLLALVFARIRQPRVIAEVIGGVILGPSVMGHIPHFRNAIFPQASIPILTLTANIGIVLFLFLVGMEIDTKLFKRNVFASATVSIAGLVIPLGLGAALGVGVYHEFVDNTVKYGTFLLFIAVAIGITAFPVLCRILTELKLLDTQVGLITLSAGIGNDVVGWILLALSVALVNSSSGLTALWVLLASTGYTLFLLFPGKWAFYWMAKRTGSIEQGSPTALMMTIALIIVFVSAFFTDIIGVHPIFGGFLAGLIIPHENGFAISIVEKLEDLVSIVFLPLYFTLSGLNTNLSLLNNGITWGYVVLICTVALFSKFISCSAAAHFNGFGWREAGAIGSLMSCKGLVELIVLNVGLQAGVLNPRVFSMFVMHAIVVTFLTTPLVLFFYPERYRVHLHSSENNGPEAISSSRNNGDDTIKTRFALVLDKMEALPAAMTLTQLLHADSGSNSPRSIDDVNSSIDEKMALERADSQPVSPRPVVIEALRLMELTTRTSALLKSQEADSLLYNDPLVTAYRTFGQLNEFTVSANISVVSSHEYPNSIAEHATSTKSEMVIVPWPRGLTSIKDEETKDGVRNPFDGVFHRTASQDQTSSVVYSEFIRNVFSRSPSDVALFIDRGMIRTFGSNKQHLFLAFIGGPDDRLALNFLVQLCGNSSVTATVVRITTKADSTMALDHKFPNDSYHEQTMISSAAADTVYPQLTTHTRLSSGLADNLLWDRYTLHSTDRSPQLRAALSRISFRTESTSKPVHRISELAKDAVRARARSSDKTLIVLAGRSRRLPVESLHLEFRKLASELGNSVSSSLPKTLGDIGAALVATNVDASLLIVQSAPSSGQS